LGLTRLLEEKDAELLEREQRIRAMEEEKVRAANGSGPSHTTNFAGAARGGTGANDLLLDLFGDSGAHESKPGEKREQVAAGGDDLLDIFGESTTGSHGGTHSGAVACQSGAGNGGALEGMLLDIFGEDAANSSSGGDQKAGAAMSRPHSISSTSSSAADTLGAPASNPFAANPFAGDGNVADADALVPVGDGALNSTPDEPQTCREVMVSEHDLLGDHPAPAGNLEQADEGSSETEGEDVKMANGGLHAMEKRLRSVERAAARERERVEKEAADERRALEERLAAVEAARFNERSERERKLEKELTQLKRQLQDLEDKLEADGKELESARSELEHQLQELREQHRTDTREKSELEQELREVRERHAVEERERAQQKDEEKEAGLKGLDERLRDMEREAARERERVEKDAARERRALEKRLAAVESDREKERAEREREHESEIGELEEELRELRMKRDAEERERHKMKRDRERVQERERERGEEMIAIKSQLASVQAQLAAAQEESRVRGAELDEQRDKMKRDRERALEPERERGEAMLAIKSQLASVQAQLAAAQEESRVRGEELDELYSEHMADMEKARAAIDAAEAAAQHVKGVSSEAIVAELVALHAELRRCKLAHGEVVQEDSGDGGDEDTVGAPGKRRSSIGVAGSSSLDVSMQRVEEVQQQLNELLEKSTGEQAETQQLLAMQEEAQEREDALRRQCHALVCVACSRGVVFATMFNACTSARAIPSRRADTPAQNRKQNATSCGKRATRSVSSSEPCSSSLNNFRRTPPTPRLRMVLPPAEVGRGAKVAMGVGWRGVWGQGRQCNS